MNFKIFFFFNSQYSFEERYHALTDTALSSNTRTDVAKKCSSFLYLLNFTLTDILAMN